MASERMTFRRVLQLYRAGWLARLPFEDGRSTRFAYSVSDAAYRKYIREPGVNDRVEQLKSSKLIHDLRLVDLRLRLEKSPKVKHYYSENLLQATQELAKDRSTRDSVDLRSDALLEVHKDEQRKFYVPFEFEASTKTKERWEKKLYDYYRRHEAEAVLWVCDGTSLIERMAAIDQEVSTGYTLKMYFANLPDVLGNPGTLTFMNAKKDKRITL